MPQYVPCISCGAAIPTNTMTCPKCGKKIAPAPPRRKWLKWMIPPLVVIAILVPLVLLATHFSKIRQAEIQRRGEEVEQKERAREDLKKQRAEEGRRILEEYKKRELADASQVQKNASGSDLDSLLGGGAPVSKLTREQVKAGLEAVRENVLRCGGPEGRGTLIIHLTIGANGSISTAEATGTFGGTPTGLCAARVVRTAKFPTAEESTEVSYPYKLEPRSQAMSPNIPKYLIDRDTLCADFKTEDNPVKKSTMAEKYARKMQGGIPLKGVDAVIQALAVDGNGDATIVLATDYTSFMGNVKRGSAAFRMLGDLGEDQPVKVTGTVTPLFNDLKAIFSSKEEQLLCGDDWMVKLIGISAR
jgi:predicted nucleic acid-binding Zn ribbon protein